MPFDQTTRNRLARFVGEAHLLLSEEFTRQLQAEYGLDPLRGESTGIERLTGLDDARRETARLLRSALDHYTAGEKDSLKARQAALQRIVREQAFTVLNRLCALRMAEARGLLVESVGHGYQSKGFMLYARLAGSGLGETSAAYRQYLFSLFDELSLDLPALFDRFSPQGRLFPGQTALLRLLEAINEAELEPLWAEDETIGWIYQYFNSKEERQQMRAESQAPRNSRELAVRNQFFTPRYVVEFLTDNTLGRIWYEMTRGETALKETCRYLVRRPREVFLGHPSLTHEDAPAWVQAILTQGDFSFMPEHPSIEEIGQFALLIDGYALAPQFGYGDVLEWSSRWMKATLDTGLAPPASGLELWLVLFAYQRGMIRHGFQTPEEQDPYQQGIRRAYELARIALQNPPEDLSQEELLQFPVYIPQRPLKDPRLIKLLDPACGSMHFGLYSFDLFERIYAEAWERGLIQAEDFGYRPEPVFLQETVRLDPQAAYRSNYYGEKMLAFDEAYVALAERNDDGAGVYVNTPYLVGEATSFRVPFARRVALRDFDYQQALRDGWFSPESGEAWVRKTGGFLYAELPAVDRETAAAEFRRQVPRLIVERNLHGIDIDPRAVQIAGLSLWLRAQKSWQAQGLRPAERPTITRAHVVCAEPMPGEPDLLDEFAAGLTPKVLGSLVKTIFEKMKLAGEAGSLLKIEEEIRSAVDAARREYNDWLLAQKKGKGYLPGLAPERLTTLFEWADLPDAESFWPEAERRLLDALRDYAEQAQNGRGFQKRMFAADAARGFAFINLCRKRYDVVVMNPPFGEASKSSKDYVESNYQSSTADIFQAFVERCLLFLLSMGREGAISARTGFFLGNSRSWREDVIFKKRLDSFVDLGLGVLDDALVEVALYIIENDIPRENKILINRQLDNREKDVRLLKAVESGVNRQENGFAEFSQSLITIIPDYTFAYWAPTSFLRRYASIALFGIRIGRVRQGIATADDFRFARLAWEIKNDSIGREQRWQRFSKGGEYSPIYDDIHLLIDWMDDGAQLNASPSARFQNIESMFNPGATYTVRTASAFAGKILPANCIFSHNAQTWFTDKVDMTLLSIGFLSCRVPQTYLELAVGSGDIATSGSAARRYTTAVVESIPSGVISEINTANNLLSIKKVFLYRVDKFALDETSCHFSRFHTKSNTISIREALNTHVKYSIRTAADALVHSALLDNAVTQAFNLTQIEHNFVNQEVGIHPCNYSSEPRESEVLRLFQLPEEKLIGEAISRQGSKRWFTKKSFFIDRRLEIICHLLKSSPETIERLLSNKDFYLGKTEFASCMISEIIGYVFGRWDIGYATGEKHPLDPPDPFAPLPACPPGMLQNAQGLPASPEDVPSDYPLRISWPGILVDDPGHPEDLLHRCEETLQVIWPERWEAIEAEASEILGVKSLRDYFRKSFFPDHLARYSKSRRQAPIYWPLSTPSGSYTLWLYYHRLDGQILYTCVMDFIDPKLKQVAEEATRLKRKSGRSKNDDREHERLSDLEAELKDLRTELLRVAAFWKPDLNDGVQITAAPLWKLFQHKPWQKKLKETWEKLEAGEYDWAHLAYSIWPERVRQKCKTDKSLAIAHDLESLYVEPPAAKKKKARKAVEAEMDDMFGDE